MITIKFADRTRRVDQWVETFEEVVLSHQLVYDRSLKEPVLTLGKEEVTGEKASVFHENISSSFYPIIAISSICLCRLR